MAASWRDYPPADALQQADRPTNYPDGLSPAVVEALIGELDSARPRRSVVPSLFVDRDAVLRSERRRTNRALKRVARTFAMHRAGTSDLGRRGAA